MVNEHISGLIVGHLVVSDHIHIKTFFNGHEYVTVIKHPRYNDGVESLVGAYDKDFKEAALEHRKWVEFICGNNVMTQQHLMEEPKKREIRVNTIKISLHVLLKILYKYAAEQQIKISPSRNHPEELHVSIPYPNKYAGSCLYDLNKMEAWGVTTKWFAILEEIRAELIDERDETIDEENASAGQHSST